MGLRRAVREIADRGSPLVGPFSQVDRGWTRSALARLAEPFEPDWGAIRRLRSQPPPSWNLVAVYRKANAGNVKLLLEQPGLAAAFLWALDEPDQDLASSTVGSGTGNRFALVNSLLEGTRASSADWVVLADDDVRYVRGDVPTTLGVAEASGLDLAQPSHARWSFLNWESTRHHWGAIARLTRYIEQGPLVCFAPAAQGRLLPFPEDVGMGWGIEARWAAQKDLSFGIVDATTIWHMRPVGGSYDVNEAWEQAERLLWENGFGSYDELQGTDAIWQGWQANCPWATA